MTPGAVIYKVELTPLCLNTAGWLRRIAGGEQHGDHTQDPQDQHREERLADLGRNGGRALSRAPTHRGKLRDREPR
jgi:hypothetical protein